VIFCDFIPVDEKQIGFLLADDTGHGVPVALIASMDPDYPVCDLQLGRPLPALHRRRD